MDSRRYNRRVLVLVRNIIEKQEAKKEGINYNRR